MRWGVGMPTSLPVSRNDTIDLPRPVEHIGIALSRPHGKLDEAVQIHGAGGGATAGGSRSRSDWNSAASRTAAKST